MAPDRAPDPAPDPARGDGGLRARAGAYLPGLALCATIAAAAAFLGGHYGAPVMLFALLIGMAFNFLAAGSACTPGVDLAARFLLRLGIALLGVRIVYEDLAAFGVGGVAAVAGLMALTIASGFVAARVFGRQWRFAVLTGGAVAVCGASAALAIAAVIPHNARTERNTLFTVIAVTTLSTVAMVLYPVLTGALGLSDRAAGFLIGATIHDVAQVVGAGYSISDMAGDTATLTKLTRVALLPVVLVAIVLALRFTGAGRGAGRVPLLPWFMLVFLALSATASLVALPPALTAGIDTASRALLVTAIAALGVKTSLRAMAAVGGGHMFVVIAETLVLLAAALALLWAVPGLV